MLDAVFSVGTFFLKKVVGFVGEAAKAVVLEVVHGALLARSARSRPSQTA
jgi:hypothetical protein